MMTMIEEKMTKIKTSKYYRVEPSHESSFYSNWSLVNYDRLQLGKEGLCAKEPWPDGVHAVTRGPWTIPDYVEAPHFVISKRKTTPLLDFGRKDGFMFISTRFKALIEELAPGACDYRPCTTEFKDGTPGPETWICSVVKIFREAVDLALSNLSIAKNGSYLFWDKETCVLKPDVVKSANLFGLTEFSGKPFCSELFRQRCKADKIRGLSFRLIGEVQN